MELPAPDLECAALPTEQALRPTEPEAPSAARAPTLMEPAQRSAEPGQTDLRPERDSPGLRRTHPRHGDSRAGLDAPSIARTASHAGPAPPLVELAPATHEAARAILLLPPRSAFMAFMITRNGPKSACLDAGGSRKGPKQ